MRLKRLSRKRCSTSAFPPNGRSTPSSTHRSLPPTRKHQSTALTSSDYHQCYIFFSPCSSDLPSSLLTRLPRTPPHSIALVSPLFPASYQSSPRPDLYTLLSTPTPSLFVSVPLLPPTLLNTEPLRSMDLPWISPGSPLRLTDTHLRVFLCFPSLASLVSPSSPHPCFLITAPSPSRFYL